MTCPEARPSSYTLTIATLSLRRALPVACGAGTALHCPPLALCVGSEVPHGCERRWIGGEKRTAKKAAPPLHARHPWPTWRVLLHAVADAPHHRHLKFACGQQKNWGGSVSVSARGNIMAAASRTRWRAHLASVQW